MRLTVTKMLMLLGVLGTSSGAAATTTNEAIEDSAGLETLDPTHRLGARKLGATPASSRRTAASAPDDDGWTRSIEARLAVLQSRPEPSRDAAALEPELAERLAEIAASAGPHARVGIAVRDLATGNSLFDLDADALLNPASNLKLLTAAAAVELLGADFRFETRIARAGDALTLVGSGDPSLQRADLQSMVDALEPADLRGVQRIIIDDTAFSDRRFGPGYDPDGPGHSYQAPSGALSLQFNTVEIAVKPRRRGEPATVTVRPACDHIVVRSSAITGRGRPLSVVTRAGDDTTQVVVGGAIRPEGPAFRIRRRVQDPGLFTGSAFARRLAHRLGAPPLPVARGKLAQNADVLHVHRSAPLVDVLGSALKYSNNFTTEQVLRTLGHLHARAPGDWDNGRAVIRRFWSALGLPSKELVFVNASGLGRDGRVTPRALAALLGAVSRPGGDAADLTGAMAIAGREGTLARRLRRTHGRVRAKTGTVSGASGLTGVISDADGSPRVAFSILVNGRVGTKRARRLQDRVVRALISGVG